jgi:tRNA dimethylallyltransferase
MNSKACETAGTCETTGTDPIFVCGPTASGKSALALDMARRLDGEIVNADAFQLYRGLEIVSAAPSAEERSLVPHHLYGALNPADAADAGSYMRLAAPVIAEIQSRGKTPVITGGSGLYLKFLTHGPAPLLQADPALRAALDARPLEDLVAELRKLDPVEASRTALQNRRFVSRALEICLLTGMRASELRDQWETRTREIASQLRGLVIRRSRPDLHARIAARTRMMLDGGAIEEVAALTEYSANCGKAIGFREIKSLIAGEIDRPTCEELINAATRQYAKRQETWFRRETWLVPREV